MGKTSSDDSFICNSHDECFGYRAVFEDDGKVAYLYLRAPDGKFLADVWVYNRRKAPSIPEWEDPSIKNPKSRLPFANPKGYASEDRIEPVTRCKDVVFFWSHGDSPAEVSVTLKIRGEVVAKVVPGSKPGWARLAVKDGPLAKVMTRETVKK